MSTIPTGRVLLVAVLVLGLTVTVPVVSAHGGETTQQSPTAPPAQADAPAWADWMESHMTEYMGPGAVEWMESNMGVSVDEMARGMANGEHYHEEHDYDHNTEAAYGHC